ncbi:MAG TPA: response regulator [Candidatus Binataceae bacterium]|nr:response regulator [Candidatus Binataceae bacterium]
MTEPGEAFIAIVDDDESVREALESLFSAAGYSASCYASAEEFLASARAKKASCLLLDLRMAGMSGLELQRQLATTATPPPIIFMTALDDPLVIAQARQGGAVDFLVKPFSEQALFQSVQAALQRRPRR